MFLLLFFQTANFLSAIFFIHLCVWWCPQGFIHTGTFFFCIHCLVTSLPNPHTSFYWWLPQSDPKAYGPWVSNLYFSLLRATFSSISLRNCVLSIYNIAFTLPPNSFFLFFLSSLMTLCHPTKKKIKKKSDSCEEFLPSSYYQGLFCSNKAVVKCLVQSWTMPFTICMNLDRSLSLSMPLSYRILRRLAA